MLVCASVNDLRRIDAFQKRIVVSFTFSHCILTEEVPKYCLSHSTFTEKELAARRTKNFALTFISDLSYIWLLLLFWLSPTKLPILLYYSYLDAFAWSCAHEVLSMYFPLSGVLRVSNAVSKIGGFSGGEAE